MKKYLLLCISVIVAMAAANAQTGDNSDFSIWGSIIPTDYSYKTIDGLESNSEDYAANTNVVRCLDFTKGPGPYQIYAPYQSKQNVKKTIKVSLYVPKKAFTESFPLICEFSYYINFEGTNGVPTLDDLDKIKEYTIELNPTNYSGVVTIPWDGMTDPAFTNGISYPVQDNVFLYITDMQTGSVLYENTASGGSHVNRYRGNYTYTYTPKEHSVVCDIYFTSQLPVKKAVPFLGFSCGFSWADRSELKKRGVEGMVLSILTRKCLLYRTNFYSYSWDDTYINAFQVFDNLSPDENGIYHISWEIKDMQGRFFDSYKMLFGDYVDSWSENYSDLGLYVESDGQEETFNLGLPEYGGHYHEGFINDYDYVSGISSNPDVLFTMPRPLKPDEPVDYPEFEIMDGILFHYHGQGGDIVIPDSVGIINDLAFYKYASDGYQGMYQLVNYENYTTQKIILPSGLTSIGNFAFHGQRDLTSITIPGFVTSIGDFAFSGCRSLKSVVISGSVISIGEYAFYGCNSPNIYFSYNSIDNTSSNLTSVTCYAATPPAADLSFSNVNLSISTLYVPQGTKALYQAAEGWKNFRTITELGAPPTGVALNQSAITVGAGNTSQLTATVAPSDVAYKDVSWSSSDNRIATVSADGKVTAIAPGTATITVITQYGGKTATCTVTVSSATAIPELNAETDAYLYNDILYVKSPVAETVQVYSVNGVLLYNFQKPAGKKDYLISQAPGSVLVVKGGSGWMKKVMK